MMAKTRIRIALGFTVFVLLSRANINIVYTSNPLDVKSNYVGGKNQSWMLAAVSKFIVSSSI